MNIFLRFTAATFEQPFHIGIWIRGLLEDDDNEHTVYAETMHNRSRVLRCSKDLVCIMCSSEQQVCCFIFRPCSCQSTVDLHCSSGNDSHNRCDDNNDPCSGGGDDNDDVDLKSLYYQLKMVKCKNI